MPRPRDLEELSIDSEDRRRGHLRSVRRDIRAEMVEAASTATPGAVPAYTSYAELPDGLPTFEAVAIGNGEVFCRVAHCVVKTPFRDTNTLKRHCRTQHQLEFEKQASGRKNASIMAQEVAHLQALAVAA